MCEKVQFIFNVQNHKVEKKCCNSFLKSSKSIENFNTVKSVMSKGTRSHSLHGQSTISCIDNSCKAIFHESTGSRGRDRRMFPAARHSRWDDARRLRLCENTNNIENSAVYSDERSVSTNQEGQSSGFPDQYQASKVDFKTLVTMFLKRSSIYALNQVGNSASTRRKIFWALIMILGILGSGIQIIQYLKAYFKYPVVVNMDSRYSLDQEFPAVTVCNLNRVRYDFLPCLKQKLNYTECNTTVEDKEDTPVVFTYDEYCPILNNNMSEVSLLRYMWTNLYVSQDEQSQFFYGHQGKDFIRSCAFNGEMCTLDNFTKTVDIDYGNCYTFNAANKSNPALKTPFVGPNGGLELELDLEIDKYMPHTRAVGARVQIHDPYHEQNVQLQGVNVSPGFETSITLSKFMMLRLQKPFKDNCKAYAVGESKDICNERCMFDMILKRCSCSFTGKNARHCDLTKMSDICCVYSPPEGVCNCPLSCEDTFYSFNIFSAVWPSTAYHAANPVNNSETGQELTYEEIRETRLKLKVYYDTLETVIYEQKAMYQSSELFSQIGGQMGLWMGLSLVAIFECVENFVLLWKYRSKNLSQIRPTM